MANVNIIECPQCSERIEFFHRPIIDRALFDRFMAGPLNPSACSGCGLNMRLDTPCAVELQGCSAVVLANPEQIDILKAAEVAHYFLNQLSPRAQDELPVLVLGREEQLRRILQRRTGDRFNAVPFEHFLSRDWESQIENLKIAADACVEAGKAEVAYWWLIEAVGMFPELYAHPMLREPIEMCVLAAGDRIAPNLKESRTAAEDFARARIELDPLVPELPDWVQRTYLCFFDDDAYFEGKPTGFASELNRLDENEGIQFGRGELHLNTLVTPIVREHVRPVERAMVDMLALMLVGELRALGIEVTEADQAMVVLLLPAFRVRWDSVLTSTDRYQVYKKYEQLTGGKDIRVEWDLPSHGLTFTIDRIESGGDPRF